MKATGIMAVTPMKVKVNEPISIKIKVLGEIRKIKSTGGFNL